MCQIESLHNFYWVSIQNKCHITIQLIMTWIRRWFVIVQVSIISHAICHLGKTSQLYWINMLKRCHILVKFILTCIERWSTSIQMLMTHALYNLEETSQLYWYVCQTTVNFQYNWLWRVLGDDQPQYNR